ncbi:MAG: site-specific integrase [Deltaproteobacteria bacterium]|nr:site-specific integrase [Deltaproteobacteria bacterium]
MAVKLREIPRGSGKWYAQINHKGRRLSRYLGKNKTEARKMVDLLQAKLTLGALNLGENSNQLYSKYAENWLEYIKAARSPATYERYFQVQRDYVLPYLGNKPVTAIKRGMIKTLLMSLLDKGLSRATVSLVSDVVSGPFVLALDDEVLQHNPSTGVLKSLKLRRKRTITVEPMTPQESQLFLETCQKISPELYAFFLCALRTGMRLGEILALEWGDIDFNSRFIRVERSYKRNRVSSTKTGKVRRVDMSLGLKEALEHLLIRRKKEGLKLGAGEVCPIVFHHQGCHMEQNMARKFFDRILKKAGIRRMRFHDLRHTFASQLLTNGESPVYVKEQMGHSSIQMTVDILRTYPQQQ